MEISVPFKDAEKQKQAQHEHYVKYKKTYAQRTRVRRARRRKWMDEIIAKLQCEKCGENHPSCLDFHHTVPHEKDGTVAKLFHDLRAERRIVQEIEKCIVLCANCHRRLHWDVKQTLSGA